LNTLNERERYVVTAFAAGASYSEVAGGLGVSESRVWTIERFARAKLEREIAC
jgi:DNA-directed RNA polymerase specialized sigma subunit